MVLDVAFVQAEGKFVDIAVLRACVMIDADQAALKTANASKRARRVGVQNSVGFDGVTNSG
jgi:hypothetical protein